MSSSEAYRLLFEESPVATIVVDREGMVLDVNRAACKTMSRARDRLVGTPILSWIVPEDRERARGTFVASVEGTPQNWTVRVRRGDGVSRVLSLRTCPLASGGSTKGVVTFARDLTEIQAGRPDTLQLQTLLENLPGQFVVALDAAGRIRYSSGLSRTHFRDDVEVIGDPYGSLVQQEDRDQRMVEFMLEELGEGRDWGGTVWHRMVDGSVFPVRTFASPYRDPRSGRVIGGLVAGRDARQEVQLRERARRAERSAAVGELVGSAGGLLRQTLAGLRKSAREAPVAADGSVLHTRDLQEALTRMERLVDSLGEFAEDIRLDRSDVELTKIVEDVLAKRGPELESRGVAVSYQNGIPLRPVFADRSQITRMLELLIDNAEDGLHSVAVRRLRVSLAAGADGQILRVADSGKPVPPEGRSRAFEPLAAPRGRAPGFGLAAVKALAEAHGGRAWVEDEGEVGWTTFAVELPEDGPESSLPFRPVSLTLTSARSILVVDDEEAVRGGLRKFLEKVGYEVREAWSGRSALAQITAGRPPDVILTDLRMTDGSGFWFLTEMSRDFPELLGRTVILTGDTGQGEAAKLARETGCPLVRKPVELPYLLEILDQTLARS